MLRSRSTRHIKNSNFTNMRYLQLSMALLVATFSLSAQQQMSAFEEFQKMADERFREFKQNSEKEYADFRKRMNERYEQFLRNEWQRVEKNEPDTIAEKDIVVVPPVVYIDNKEDEPVREDEEIMIEEKIVIPEPEPQPEPVVEIEETPVVEDATFAFSFYNTEMKVRIDRDLKFSLSYLSEDAIANAWQVCADERNNNLILDCLRLRREHRLCDWAYVQMLNVLSESRFGKGSNEATFLMAYIYAQSGYRMRFAMADNRLYMLYASNYTIYGKRYWQLDGDNYYVLNGTPDGLYISQAALPQEQTLSLLMSEQPVLREKLTEQRVLRSADYPDMVLHSRVNANMLDFYNTYPTSMIDNDFGTRWAMYADAELSKTVKASIYPTLRSRLNGLDEWQKVSLLLNFVQKAFVYEYDDRVWGEDRAFFAEETLFYPYADCEDRSILFPFGSRLGGSRCCIALLSRAFGHCCGVFR